MRTGRSVYTLYQLPRLSGRATSTITGGIKATYVPVVVNSIVSTCQLRLAFHDKAAIPLGAWALSQSSLKTLWYLVPVTRYHAERLLDSSHLVPGTGTWTLLPGTWYRVHQGDILATYYR